MTPVSQAAPPRPQPVESGPVDDLPLLDMPVSVPVVKPVRETAPPPDNTPQVVGPYSRVPASVPSVPKPSKTVPMGGGTVHSVRDTAGAKEKAIQRLAKQVQADLIAGTLVDHRSQKPLTTKISNRALGGYTSSSDSRKSILDCLAKWGVIEYRNSVAYITDDYKPKPAQVDALKADTISALTNGKPLKFSASEAEIMYQNSTGTRLDDRIASALKSKANEVR